TPEGNCKTISFQTAVADYRRVGFEPENSFKKLSKENEKGAKPKSWAFGDDTRQPHALTLVTPAPVTVPDGATVTVIIDLVSAHTQHIITHFRLAVTADARAADW